MTSSENTFNIIGTDTTYKFQNINKYLIFELHQLLYGVDISNVVEILEYQQPVQVPNLANFVHGLFNLRGEIVTIIDFNLYLGGSSSIISKKTCIVIIDYLLNDKITNVGILVDNVLDVLEISANILENNSNLICSLKPEFIKSTFMLHDKIITLLNVNNIFSTIAR